MSPMTWTEEMSVGVKELDEDHKKLICMMNEVHDAVLSNLPKAELRHVVDELVSYTSVHFAREEDLFGKTGYSNAVEHTNEHDRLLAKVLRLQAGFNAGFMSTISAEVMQYMKNWLFRHILEYDKAYGPHLNTNGVA
jgi:hemerythrin